MKKTIALIITAILVIGMLAACGKKEEAPQDGQSAAAPSGAIAAPDTLSGELNIYAAASMTESLDKVIGLFNAQHLSFREPVLKCFRTSACWSFLMTIRQALLLLQI